MRRHATSFPTPWIRSLVLVLGVLGLVGCGTEVPAPAPSIEPGVVGKPNPELGRLEVRIIGRPAADRAVVEAVWVLGDTAETCELVFGLPEGAYLVEGEARAATPDGTRQGVTHWTVGFPAGRTLDAVIRLCGHVPRQDPARGHRIVEGLVRLVDAD